MAAHALVGTLRAAQARYPGDPALGTISLDCDTMLLPDSQQTVLVYAAEPGGSPARSSEIGAVERVPGGDSVGCRASMARTASRARRVTL